jgi:predicted DNA-binding transcriptional regulator YafY
MLNGLLELGLNYEQDSDENILNQDEDHHLVKRWKLSGLPFAVLNLSETERASLERHLATMKQGPAAAALTKVIANSTNVKSMRLRGSLEELIERTAHTGRVSPRTAENVNQMSILEEAIEGREEISFLYRSQTAKKASVRAVRPLGLLFSRFGYLVASTGSRAPASYRLDLLKDVKLLGTYFEPKSNWDFKAWGDESFGVFHGDDLIKVKLRFSKKVADRAKQIVFHKSQSHSNSRNGELIVEFSCRGHREIIWEILQPDWIGEIKIEAPCALKDEYNEYLERARSAIST